MFLNRCSGSRRSHYRSMAMSGREPHALDGAVRMALAPRKGKFLLAVSGGCDSMVLLRAASTTSHQSIAAVATFDHGTGAPATQAVELVRDLAQSMGLPVVVGSNRAPHHPRRGV